MRKIIRNYRDARQATQATQAIQTTKIMELLPQAQTNSVQVLWEDQQNINKFSSLISTKDELTAQLDKFKTEKDYLDDLSLEIELLDEDEKVQYKLGDVFVFITVEKALQRIESDNSTLSNKMESLESEIDSIDSQLNELKASLYSKFGKNINLER